MLTLIISIMFGLIAGWASSLEYDMTWAIIIAVSVFSVFWIGIGLFIRRQINKVNATIQDQMGEAQKRINRKLQMFQNKPGANVKSVQKTLEKDQNEAIVAALKTTSSD